jgi:hypothetical protein
VNESLQEALQGEFALGQSAIHENDRGDLGPLGPLEASVAS